MAKRIEPRYECIAYLSVEADLNVVDRLEDKQLNMQRLITLKL